MFNPEGFRKYSDKYIAEEKPKCINHNYCGGEPAIGEFWDRDSDGFGGQVARTIKFCKKCLEHNNAAYERLLGSKK